MEHKDISVDVGSNQLSVTFAYREQEDKKQVCVITTEDRQLIVDEQQKILSNDMPEEWVQPILKVLTEIASGY